MPTREIHEKDLHRSDASEELRKTTHFDIGEDQVPSMVVDGLIDDGFDGLISSGFDGFDMRSWWCWMWLRLAMGLICICWVDPFDRLHLLGLID